MLLIELEQEAIKARHEASAHYRYARKLLREAGSYDTAAANYDFLSESSEKDGDLAQSELYSANAAAFRRLAAQNRQLAPKYREFARSAAERKRSYEDMITQRRRELCLSTV